MHLSRVEALTSTLRADGSVVRKGNALTTGTSGGVVVDDASLVIAQRALSYHPSAPGTSAVSTPIVVDDANLQMAVRVLQFHQQAPVTATAGPSATDVLQTQVFGA